MTKRLDLSSKSRWIFYAGTLLALLPLMSLRDFTPDNELRYLSITDEALRNHDFFAFYNHGLPYADKPPLYFWLLMLCRWIAGQHYMWLLSLCSLLPAFGVIAVMEKWTARWRVSSQAAESSSGDASGTLPSARMMLMTSAYFLGASVILRMDMLMCLFIVLSLFTFWKMHEGQAKRRDTWLFPIYLFLALFTKGPLGILIPLCSIVAFLVLERRIRFFPKFWGWKTWGVLLGMCALWFLGVYADGGKEYLDNLLFHQTIDRAVDSFHHKRPFYYYLIAIWYILAPWSLYVVGTMIADLRRRATLPSLQQFFLTISLTTLVLLSCISSKLQIYLLPALPFMVYSSMLSMPKYQDKLLTKLAIGFPSAIFALALPAVGAAIYFGWVEYDGPAFAYDAATILTAGGFYGLLMLVRKGVYASIKSAGWTLLAAVFVGAWAMPYFNPAMGYGEVCRKAADISAKENIDDIYVWKIKRAENMDVYLGKEVIILNEDSIPDLSQTGHSLLIVKDKDANDLRPLHAEKIGPYAIIRTDTATSKPPRQGVASIIESNQSAAAFASFLTPF